MPYVLTLTKINSSDYNAHKVLSSQILAVLTERDLESIVTIVSPQMQKVCCGIRKYLLNLHICIHIWSFGCNSSHYISSTIPKLGTCVDIYSSDCFSLTLYFFVWKR